VTLRMLLRMGNMAAKLTRVSWEAPLERRDHVFWQGVEGDEPFPYLLSLGAPQTLAIGRRMLEPLQGAEVPDAVDGLVVDVVKELVNLIVLQVCTRLGRDGRRYTPSFPEAGEPPAARTRVVVELALPQGSAGVAVDVP
jgi:hypothetical protein